MQLVNLIILIFIILVLSVLAFLKIIIKFSWGLKIMDWGSKNYGLGHKMWGTIDFKEVQQFQLDFEMNVPWESIYFKI